MYDGGEMAERHARILRRLSEIGEAVAEKLADQVLSAETPEATAFAAAAFDRLARGLRLTLALEARLARQQRQEAREQAEHAERRDAIRRAGRALAAGRGVARRVIADYEAERDDAEAHPRLMRRLAALRELVDDAALVIELDGDLADDVEGLRLALDTLLPDDAALEREPAFEPG